MKAWIAILPAVALAACSPQAGEEGAGGDPAGTAPQAVKPSVNLDATGITVPAQAGNEAILVPFGTVREDTENALSRALGSIKDRQSNRDCPAGPMKTTVYDGIVLTFQGDEFVGWMADGGDYVPGMTRAELAANSGGLTPVADSSLGAEFVLGQDEEATITFLFDGAGEAARPVRLWAGANCIFR